MTQNQVVWFKMYHSVFVNGFTSRVVFEETGMEKKGKERFVELNRNASN